MNESVISLGTGWSLFTSREPCPTREHCWCWRERSRGHDCLTFHADVGMKWCGHLFSFYGLSSVLKDGDLVYLSNRYWKDERIWYGQWEAQETAGRKAPGQEDVLQVQSQVGSSCCQGHIIESFLDGISVGLQTNYFIYFSLGFLMCKMGQPIKPSTL